MGDLHHYVAGKSGSSSSRMRLRAAAPVVDLKCVIAVTASMRPFPHPQGSLASTSSLEWQLQIFPGQHRLRRPQLPKVVLGKSRGARVL